ncbi:MAG TPA: DUF6438 domain-containing protein [Polyangia bacterium]|nr:DUF6438 domain-containing protein [Polyangia bacterium]
MERRRSASPPLPLLALLLLPRLAACSGAHEATAIDRGPGFVPPTPPPRLIRLERAGTGTCPGQCPTYSVEVDVDGGVTYTGVLNVKTIGRRTDQMSIEALQQLRTVMAKARQAKLPRERCAVGTVKDAQTVTLTLWEKRVPRTVAYEEGCEHVPHPLRVLEGSLDELVGVERWTGTIQQRRLCFEEQRDCADFGTPEPARPDGGR